MSVSVLEQFAAGDLADWQGLPPGLPPAEVFGRFGRVGGEARAPIGEGEASFVYVRAGEYSHPVRVWIDGEAAIVLDVATPEMAERVAELRAVLGPPDEELDYRWGTIPVDRGEWVYGARGLTLFANTDATRLVHVAVYAPTTPDEYRRRLRVDLGERHLPRRRGAGLE